MSKNDKKLRNKTKETEMKSVNTVIENTTVENVKEPSVIPVNNKPQEETPSRRWNDTPHIVEKPSVQNDPAPMYQDQIFGTSYQYSWDADRVNMKAVLKITKKFRKGMIIFGYTAEYKDYTLGTVLDGKVLTHTKTHTILYLGGYLFVSIDNKTKEINDCILYNTLVEYDKAIKAFFHRNNVFDVNSALNVAKGLILEFCNVVDPLYWGSDKSDVVLPLLMQKAVYKTTAVLPHIKSFKINRYKEGAEFFTEKVPFSNIETSNGTFYTLYYLREDPNKYSYKVEYKKDGRSEVKQDDFYDIADFTKFIEKVVRGASTSINVHFKNICTIIARLACRDLIAELFDSDTANFYTYDAQDKVVQCVSPVSSYYDRMQDEIKEEKISSINSTNNFEEELLRDLLGEEEIKVNTVKETFNEVKENTSFIIPGLLGVM